jgi:predicted RNA-binding protein with PIN domain
MLGPILDFANLPERALGMVRDALDGDSGFRSRVIEQVAPDSLDEGSRLFLMRPEGWSVALQALVEEGSRRAESDGLAERHAAAAEALRVLTDSRDQLRSERDALADSVAEFRRSTVADAARIEALQVQLAEALGAIDDLKQERREAVRQLKAQESLSQRRLERQRELEEALEHQLEAVHATQQTDSDPLRLSPIGHAELEYVTASVAEVTAGVGELADVVSGLADFLRSLAGIDDEDHKAPGRFRRDAQQIGATRGRRAVRLGRGLEADSIEGFDALLALPGVVVMLDGYNVSMKGWPNLGVSQQRESLMHATGALQARGRATWHLVFDGAHDGGRPAVSAPLPVRVHFTPSGVEADDQLLEFVEQTPDEVPVVVVSSDRRVRDGARERGANVVSSETLLSSMRR